MAFSYIRGAGLALVALWSFVAFAQVPEKMVGSVSSISLANATLDVKGQDGNAVTILIPPGAVDVVEIARVYNEGKLLGTGQIKADGKLWPRRLIAGSP